MRTFAKLFGRSPFVPLQTHMEKVAATVGKAAEALRAFAEGKYDDLDELARAVSKLEHEADQVKNDIRNHLRKSYFMPIDQSALLQILSSQDAIADRAENLAVVLTFKNLPLLPAIRENFQAFIDKNLDAFEQVREVIQQLDELIESGFGGAEAERVRQQVETVALREHEADVIQRTLIKAVCAHDEELSQGEFYLWMQLIRQIAALSNESEYLANRVRMTLEIK